MTQTVDHQFFRKVLPVCNAAAGTQLLCIRRSVDPCDAYGRFGASPPWLCRANRCARVAESADAGPSSGLSLAIYRIF
jgi:hypothetical protein